MKLIDKISGLGIKRKHAFALALFVFLSVFHSFIANDKYIICKSGKGIHFFHEKGECGFGIPALIPYASNTLDKDNRGVSPFEKQNVSSLYYRHWLGTDSLGRDVLAGLIYGSFLALMIGLVASILALCIGIFMAYISAYIGDERFTLTKEYFIILICEILLLFNTALNAKPQF